MKVNFRDVSGTSTAIYVSVDSTVSDACKTLSIELKIPENRLFLVCPNENKNFYESDDSMQEVTNENPDYIVFMKCFSLNKKASKVTHNEIEENTNSYTANNYYNNILIKYNRRSRKYGVNSLKKVPYNILLLLNIARRWNNSRRNPIYIEYSNCLAKIPDDFQQKIDEIAVLGFEIEDIKEALRSCEYNVLFAINSLVYRNSNEKNEQEENRSRLRLQARGTAAASRNSQINNNFIRTANLSRRLNNNFMVFSSNRNMDPNNNFGNRSIRRFGVLNQNLSKRNNNNPIAMNAASIDGNDSNATLK